MGKSVASEPLYSFIIVIYMYDILIVFSFPFLTAPSEMVAVANLKIYLMIYLIYNKY